MPGASIAPGGTGGGTGGRTSMPPSTGGHPPLKRPADFATALGLRRTLGVLATVAVLFPVAARAGGPPIGADLRAYAQPRTLKILGVGAAAAAASLSFENAAAEHSLFEKPGLDPTSDVGNEYASGVTMAALSGSLFGAGLLTDDATLRKTGGEMARGIVYTTVAVSTLKVAFHRTRPNGGAYSFPSGHTTLAFAMAPILAQNLGWRAGVPAYALAGATGMGRMEDSKHYLSDVLFGAALGLSIGVAVSGHDALPERVELRAAPGGAAVSYHF